MQHVCPACLAYCDCALWDDAALQPQCAHCVPVTEPELLPGRPLQISVEDSTDMGEQV